MTVLDLTFNTEEPELVRLAKAYWSREADGEWSHTVAQLSMLFPGRKSIYALVGKSCTARSPVILCQHPDCGNPLEIPNRLAFDAYRNAISQPPSKLKSPRGVQWCANCIGDFREAIGRRREAEQLAQRIKIEGWLETQSARRSSRSLAELDTIAAFLLYGILESAGDNWHGDQLLAWERYTPLLFAHEEDTSNTFHWLHEAGWLLPLGNDPDVFSLGPDGAVSFNWKSIKWALPLECSTVTQAAVLEMLASKMNQATTSDLVALWNRVCVSELRRQFNKCERRAEIRSAGWTQLIEANFMRLLDRYSLSQLMGVVWNCFKELKWQQAGYRSVANKIPGAFDRMIDSYVANNRTIDAWWSPQNREDKPRYTSLLFDKVLAGGDESYRLLTRARLAACAQAGDQTTRIAP